MPAIGHAPQVAATPSPSSGALRALRRLGFSTALAFGACSATANANAAQPSDPSSSPPSPTHTQSADPAYESFFTGNAADATPAAVSGGLLLMGGGGDVDAAFRWFIQQAAGGDLVVLRASGGNGYNDYLHRTLGGVDSVQTIVFRSRAAAADPDVLAAIARAEGVFIAGGDQSRYIRFWKDTPLAAALNAHVRAGKPLGGTSAGLAVLGEFYFSADFDPATQGGELTSAAAVRDPDDHRITLDTGFLTIPRLRGVITDSHFSQRDRAGRLRVFLARLAARTGRTDLVGLGVDERTALCIDADGTARVIASEGGQVHALRLATPPTAHKPLPATLPLPPAALRFPLSP